MKKEYDFSKSIRNPYAVKLKQQITIRLDAQTLSYFKKLSVETGMSYQHLINFYLSECAKKEMRLSFEVPRV